MPIPVIPDFAAAQAPDLDDVRAAEQALVEVVGGVHEDVRYPGAIGADNFDPALQFKPAQVEETYSRIALATARWGEVQDYTAPAARFPSIANGEWDRCLILVPVRIEADTIVIWHNRVATLNGLIEARINGEKVADLALPSEGIDRGVTAELVFPFTLAAGDVVELLYLDPGQTTYLKTTGGAAPPTALAVFAQLWGVTRHVA